MASGPKLNLPTVDTCRWRSAPQLDGTADCGLIRSMIGPDSTESSRISLETCVACCNSFPPSPRRLNPVVASILYKAASRLLKTASASATNKELLERTRQQAEQSLDLIHPKQLQLMPSRSDKGCCWLGNQHEVDHHRDHSPETGTAHPSAENQSELRFSCHHPAHNLTTLAGCRMCRDWSIRPPISRLLSLDEMIPSSERRCGPAVKRWAIGVTTSSRRQQTLESCLDSIVRSGWDNPRLFLDGTCPIPSRYNNLIVTWREDLIGALPAWYLALTELVLQQPESDAFVLLQDDVVLYDRESLREYLERKLWPGDRPSIVSLFSTDPAPQAGWRQMQNFWHWGAQGFIFPPEMARAMISDVDFTRTCLAASASKHTPIPTAMSEWISRNQVEVWFTNPSLSQHIGNTSTIWANAAMTAGCRAPWYCGSIGTTFTTQETLSDFPELLFPCDQSTLESYLNRVDRGNELMRKSSVVICGLCRNVRLFLARTAARIEKLGSMFHDYRIILYENDSIDATREFLTDWASQNPRLEVISETLSAKLHLKNRSLERATWMARCRNRYRERVNEKYQDFDYTMVVDTDLPGGWSFDGIAHTFGHDNWDVIGSYGIQRRSAHEPNECPYTHFDTWAFHPAAGTAARELVNHNDLVFRRGDPMIPVESSFGGLGIYRTACMSAAEYGGSDCEHVVFHNQLRLAGFNRQFLNPSQIVLYSPYL